MKIFKKIIHAVSTNEYVVLEIESGAGMLKENSLQARKLLSRIFKNIFRKRIRKTLSKRDQNQSNRKYSLSDYNFYLSQAIDKSTTN